MPAVSKELMPSQPGLKNVLWSICQGVARGLCARPCPWAAFSAARLRSTGSELTLAAARCDPVGICRAQRLALLGRGCPESGSAGRRLCSCLGCPFLLRAYCKPKIPARLLVGQQCSVRKCHCKWRHKQLEGMADASREGEEAVGDHPQAHGPSPALF